MKKGATREEIFESIRAAPGTYRLRLCKELGLPWGTVAYHVRVLKAEGRVEQRTHKGRAILFVEGHSNADARLGASMHTPGAREVLQNLDPSRGAGIQEISARVHLSRKVVRRILEDFVDSGLLERQPGLRGKFLLADPGLLPEFSRLAAPGQLVSEAEVGRRMPPRFG